MNLMRDGNIPRPHPQNSERESSPPRSNRATYVASFARRLSTQISVKASITPGRSNQGTVSAKPSSTMASWIEQKS